MKIFNVVVLLFIFVGITYAQQPSKDLDVSSLGSKLLNKTIKEFHGQEISILDDKEKKEYLSKIEIPEYFYDTLKIEEKITKILYGFKTIEMNKDTSLNDNSVLIKNIYYKYGQQTHILISYYRNMDNRMFILIFIKE